MVPRLAAASIFAVGILSFFCIQNAIGKVPSLAVQQQRAKEWMPYFQEGIEKYHLDQYGITPQILIGLASRESGMQAALGDKKADGYHGYGVLQVDKNDSLQWTKTDGWKDPRDGILQGCRVLSEKYQQLKKLEGTKGIPVKESSTGKVYHFDGTPMTKEQFRQVGIAAYNCGRWAYRNFSKFNNPDRGTTPGVSGKRDYFSDVYSRAQSIGKALGLPSGAAGTPPPWPQSTPSPAPAPSPSPAPAPHPNPGPNPYPGPVPPHPGPGPNDPYNPLPEPEPNPGPGTITPEPTPEPSQNSSPEPEPTPEPPPPIPEPAPAPEPEPTPAPEPYPMPPMAGDPGGGGFGDMGIVPGNKPKAPWMQTYAVLMETADGVAAYRAKYHHLPPTNENHDLLALLLNDTTKKGKPLLTLDTGGMDGMGRIVDGWGTPIEISFIGSKHFVIKSAGPNKKWNTRDDVLASDDGKIRSDGKVIPTAK